MTVDASGFAHIVVHVENVSVGGSSNSVRSFWTEVADDLAYNYVALLSGALERVVDLAL